MASASMNFTATIINGVTHIYRDGIYLGWMRGDEVVSPVTEAETNAMLAAALKKRKAG
jgi:hypothetical protein